MRYVLALVAILIIAGCATARTSPPAAQQGYVATEATAVASGDHKGAKAAAVAISEEGRIQTDNRFSWLSVAGVVVIALGAFMIVEQAGLLGWAVVAGGTALIVGSLVGTWMNDHRGLVLLVALGLAALAAIWHYRKGFKGLTAVAHGTEHLASGGVRNLIARVRSNGPSLWVKAKSLLHLHAVTALPTAVPTKPPTP